MVLFTKKKLSAQQQTSLKTSPAVIVLIQCYSGRVNNNITGTTTTASNVRSISGKLKSLYSATTFIFNEFKTQWMPCPSVCSHLHCIKY